VDVIPGQLPWWIAGPGVGLCVVALYAVANLKLGVSGGWLQLVLAVQRRPVSEPWRLWFVLGLAIGAVLAARLGARHVSGYGDLSDVLAPVPLVLVLLGVGMLIGYGARWAGGCTSGHGISGCSAGSPESFATTGTFFAVAIAVTFVLHGLTGGAL
jgi:uncharacterized membrane protein YedE/YeeE